MLFLCIFLGTAVTSITADCVLTPHGQGFFPPFVFSLDGDLLPTNGFDELQRTIAIPANDEVILSCAPNHFHKDSLSETKTAKCVDHSLDVDDNIRKGCKLQAVTEILRKIPGCPDTATSIEFGYENPVKEETIVIGEACYDENKGRTIFLHSRIVNDESSSYAILKVEPVNYLTEAHPDYWYKAKFFAAASVGPLNDRLKSLLSTESVPQLTYRSLINLPMFQNGQLHSALEAGWNLAISNGQNELSNYDLLQKDIMSLYKTGVDIYFGTHSTFSVKTEGKGAVDIHLYPDVQQYPVPKYLWAVVKNGVTGAGFLISNDVDATVEELTASQLCESKCEQMTWLTNLLNGNAYKKPENGFVTCCDLDSFKGKISELPPIDGEYNLLI